MTQLEGHLDEMTCLLYLEGQLDPARARQVSGHSEECAACRTLLRVLEREARLLKRSLVEEEESLPARLLAVPGHHGRSMQWIWGAAFGLAATGAYALYTGYIEPWLSQLDQAGFGGTNLLGLLVFQGAFWKGWQSMFSLFEMLAVLIVAGTGLLFVRRWMRRSSTLALLLAGLCAAAAFPAPAGAAEIRHEQAYTLGKDQVIKNDLYVSAGRARIDGTVDGDVFVFCQAVDINGHVTGDVIAFAQSVRVNGQVDGNVRSFNNNVTITGTVGKNMMAFGQSATVDANGKVGGSITSFGETLSVDGTVGRDLLLFFAHGNLGGKIGGGIRAKGDSLVITSTAVIDGPVHFEGHKQAEVSPSAKLASPVEFKQLKKKESYRESSYYIWQVIWAAAYILFGMVLFALMPKFSEDAVRSAEHYGASAGLGVLAGFGAPIAACIACVTVVGLFIGLATLSVWYGSLYFGQVIVGALVGQWLMGRTSELWPLIGRMVVGVVIVRLLTMVPHVGWVFKYGTAFWGIGAISLALYRRFAPTPTLPAATAA